ncbi:hypothetical protein O6H91_01G002400 [Diphasiastrum complanatum]|uniref:Uncharacterized protein n=5 Tax=Diphasiastrum complanatum TaxID=34168 RepID=A0ACC2EMH6_DIPCM|nr:hypothetical protein O6H91_01G002400 [Diphasiastrum complanatum]KAJ7567693.1 hypothetical protein O6H91_01G002400 [Diphasiastrum complanatum]KAJ7567694.1 hypothetical protein O6H91_01G002400 [Diphasiastrum complanatum]KAJ7567695.1 hypothetical protein O6H91_01G002400 [Diphasiastrum complanatum]KAJ7567696.1 hypothetical protein O6H91_01G002400 [Diphasiastrum complanatum]
MSKTAKARKGLSKESTSVNAVFVSEAVAETDGISLRHSGMCKSDARRASNNVFDSTSEDSSSLKRKSMSVNAVSYKPTRLGVSSSAFDCARSTMSKQERREFRKKLKLELDQLVGLTSKIEERVCQLKGSSGSAGGLACNSGHLSRIDGEGSAEKEVTSVPASKIEKSRSFTRESQIAASSMVLSDGNLSTPRSVGKEKRMPKANQMYLNSEYLSGNEKMPPPEKFKSKASMGAKRLLQEKVVTDSKRQKLEQVHNKRVGDIMKQCGTLLKKLMTHKHGWVFNDPVDAVKLGLPDYHKVIRSPMDLGTIRNKVFSRKYSSPQEFATDVRLTFANAMKYNPKGHDVHIMADILRQIFEEKWKCIDQKIKEPTTEAIDVPGDTQELLDIKQQLQRLKGQVVSLSKSRPTTEKARCNGVPNRDMSFDEKRMLSEKVKDIPGDLMEQVIYLLKKSNPNLVQDGADIEIDLDSLNWKTLWELDHFLTDSVNGKGKRRRAILKDQQIQNEEKAAAKASHAERSKGVPVGQDVDIGDQVAYNARGVESEKAVRGCASKLSSSSSSSSDSGSSSSDSDSGSSSASDSEDEDAQTAGDPAVLALPQKETEPSRLPPDSEVSPHSRGIAGDNLGVQSCDVEEHLASNDDVRAESKEALPARQLSPDKLLRAALLKGRFADTILKAKEKTLPLSKNEKFDPEKLKKERDELARRQRQERARLQAEAKAAELARKKAEADAAFEMRRKREEEREAARLALQQMERTVEFNQEIELSKDLEILGNVPLEQISSSGGEVSPASSPDGLPAFGFRSGNPLEQLGLFMKDDYEDDYEKQGDGEVADAEIAYESGDVEEGEIDQ